MAGPFTPVKDLFNDLDQLRWMCRIWDINLDLSRSSIFLSSDIVMVAFRQQCDVYSIDFHRTSKSITRPSRFMIGDTHRT